MRFEESILQPAPERRRRIVRILEAALSAVDPAAAVDRTLHLDGERLRVGESVLNLERFEQIYLIGAGKAGAPMVGAVEQILGERISDGHVVVKHGHGGKSRTVTISEAGHPVPDRAGVAAGRRILEIADRAGENDLVIALLSGGGSALLVAPAEGLSLDHLQEMNRVLLACGATIDEINVLRKHCSAVKGGQLARAVHPATLVTLVLSDVIGSPLDVIASGPTVADRTTWSDAWAIVEHYGLEQSLPAPVLDRLRRGLEGDILDTPKPDNPIFARSQSLVIADNRSGAIAAARKAEAEGFETILLTTFLDGPADGAGRLLAALGKEILASGHPIGRPGCVILGGETTVVLGSDPGQGGRNQEVALSAAVALEGTDAITVVSLATDGSDGPTDSAGALADGGTVLRGSRLYLNANTHLREHNAYPFLEATHDLLRSGPTRTNVNDLLFVFVEE